MTKPIRPLNLIKYGGVEFNSNDIASKKKVSNEQGNIRYSVFLKNGVQLEYPEQNKNNKASIFVNTSFPGVKVNYVEANNLAYGKIKGTDERDLIILNGNNGTTVDISNDNKDDDCVTIGDTENGLPYGYKQEVEKNYVRSQKNTIITDENDTIYVQTNDAVAEIKGEGITTEESLKGFIDNRRDF